jgi:hypothetical protein
MKLGGRQATRAPSAGLVEQQHDLLLRSLIRKCTSTFMLGAMHTGRQAALAVLEQAQRVGVSSSSTS